MVGAVAVDPSGAAVSAELPLVADGLGGDGSYGEAGRPFKQSRSILGLLGNVRGGFLHKNRRRGVNGVVLRVLDAAAEHTVEDVFCHTRERLVVVQITVCTVILPSQTAVVAVLPAIGQIHADCIDLDAEMIAHIQPLVGGGLLRDLDVIRVVLHCRGRVGLSCRLGDHGITVLVHDHDPELMTAGGCIQRSGVPVAVVVELELPAALVGAGAGVFVDLQRADGISGGVRFGVGEDQRFRDRIFFR